MFLLILWINCGLVLIWWWRRSRRKTDEFLDQWFWDNRESIGETYHRIQRIKSRSW